VPGRIVALYTEKVKCTIIIYLDVLIVLQHWTFLLCMHSDRNLASTRQQ